MNQSNQPQGNVAAAPNKSVASSNFNSTSGKVEGWEKMASIGGGALLLTRGLRKGGIFGLANMAMGACAIYRGMSGHCALKSKIMNKIN